MSLVITFVVMQYLQKFIQKDHGFTYSLDASIPYPLSFWSLHHGHSKETNAPALVFHHPPTSPVAPAPLNSAHTRLKTLRHPDILKYLTSVQASDGTIYIATEPAVPLSHILSTSPPDPDSILWGLFTIARALGFLHDQGLIHARLNPSSVFVTPAGDWKLAGFETVTPHQSPAMLNENPMLQSDPYKSPELIRGAWEMIARASPSAIDSWALGCLMFEAHSGSLTKPDQLKNLSALPKPLVPAYQKLLAGNPSSRAPAGQLPNHPYFQLSKFVELNLFVDNLALKGGLEREAFLSKLPTTMDRLPDRFCTHKILPMLSQSIETGIGGSSALTCVIKLKSRMSEQSFSDNVVNKYAVGWFSNPALEKGLKTQLYNKLDLFASHMDDTSLNTKLFPAMCTAFQDAQNPALRDAAVKSVLCISNRLNEKNLNSTLMTHFARLQVDPEPAIRTNTTVCLGKVATRLSPSARNKVLAAAFLRALKDPFPHARAAGVNAILATTDMYGAKEAATRLLPAIVMLLVDSSTEVRKVSFEVLGEVVKRLERNHEDMTRREEAGAIGNGDGSGQKSGSLSSSGWGLSSFSSMTSAWMSKTESSSGGGGSSTGISSEDFKNKKIMNGKSESVSGIGSGSVNAGMGMNINSNTMSIGTGSVKTMESKADSGFGMFDDIGNEGMGGNVVDDDDDDGWGDMDIKSSEKDEKANEEDLFVAMMGKTSIKTSVKTKTEGSGIRSGRSENNVSNGSKSSGGDDLWDLAPPLVVKPKTKTTGTRSRGLGATSRRGKKAGGGATEDWEMLLGGSGSSRRKTAGRG